MDIDPDKWLKDSISDSLIQLHRLDEVLYDGRTEYQDIRIVRADNLGLCLVLDGKIQSADVDEFVYHEGLVQPAMLAHPCPETVFIAGGGEGATLREVLSHATVKKAVMVDIDGEVISFSRKYLPGRSRGAFEDSRTELHVADARGFLAECREIFDVVIIDLPDPIEEGPAYLLYTREFYQLVADRLTKNGIISVQAGSASLTGLLNLTTVNNTLSSIFPIVRTGKVDMPCFGGPWGFTMASQSLDPSHLTPAEVDERIAARALPALRFYDGLTHRGMFSLPKYLREALSRQTRLITDDEPLYTYIKR
ncbi:polyamine aminopropyltransferase [Chloroflexota bacterium]